MLHRSHDASRMGTGGPSGDAEKVVIKKLVDHRRYQRNSAREKCFEVIEDGMTLSEYLAAARRRKIPRTLAIGCLNKLTAQGQTVRARRRANGRQRH